jgi:hypothetical protein
LSGAPDKGNDGPAGDDGVLVDRCGAGGC